MNAASPSTLTPERRRTLEAVVARILPGVDGPGAAEARVAVAVEGGMMHRCMRGLRGGIEQMLDRLESQAAERHAHEFCACEPSERDELLRELERDPNPWTQFLFRYLVMFSVQGLLGDPVHGGNADARGWTAIGLRVEEVRSGMCHGARSVN